MTFDLNIPDYYYIDYIRIYTLRIDIYQPNITIPIIEITRIHELRPASTIQLKCYIAGIIPFELE